MGSCFTSSRPEDDMRGLSSSQTNSQQTSDPRYKKNVFKQPSGQDYIVESRVSLAYAAKENTQQILNQQQNNISSNQQNKQPNNNEPDRNSVDFFQSGKFTFEPNAKPPIHQAANNDIIDNGGVSFGFGNPKLLQNENHISFADESFRQKQQSTSIIAEDIKEQIHEEDKAE